VSCKIRFSEFGTNGSEVQILSPRPLNSIISIDIRTRLGVPGRVPTHRHFVFAEGLRRVISVALTLRHSKIKNYIRARLRAAYEHISGSWPVERFRPITNLPAYQATYASVAHSCPARPSY